MRKILSFSLIFILVMTFTLKVEALSDKPIHWGFKKGHNEQQADAGATYDALLEKYSAFYKGNPSEKIVYLTFDNGYENGFTEQVLDVLKKEKVPATFFVTGHYLESAPDLAKRMVTDGHIIGNHSWSHPDMTQIGDEKIKEELEKVSKKTEQLTGQKGMQYLRPPRGILNERTLKVAGDAGYIHVLWSLAFKDWETNNQKGWKYAYDNIMKQVHPGAVILLHTVSKDNAEALEKVIKDLKNRGYEFRSLDDFMMKEKLDVPLMGW
ncbi:delta-lactam-biosynthetic de-N-acetylase [Bacillus niameyensis]|uniref:delta-lactam-biosynthetic de-N-acetylase n=1 Tax=Bacillus niameyensis TaxID=1522308 RepID=UPI000785E008|nr:delta-lactam-biosynthetic de-N-acetylase [Bacillus niameyensis]